MTYLGTLGDARWTMQFCARGHVERGVYIQMTWRRVPDRADNNTKPSIASPFPHPVFLLWFASLCMAALDWLTALSCVLPCKQQRDSASRIVKT